MEKIRASDPPPSSLVTELEQETTVEEYIELAVNKANVLGKQINIIQVLAGDTIDDEKSKRQAVQAVDITCMVSIISYRPFSSTSSCDCDVRGLRRE